MSEPVIVEPVIMKSTGDCWAACLAMLFGIPYAKVVQAAPKRGRPQNNGLGTRQITNLAKRLRLSITYRSTGPDEDDVGILDLLRMDKTDGHAVMYLKGIVYNPADNIIYTDLDTFLRGGRWTVYGFWWRDE